MRPLIIKKTNAQDASNLTNLFQSVQFELFMNGPGSQLSLVFKFENRGQLGQFIKNNKLNCPPNYNLEKLTASIPVAWIYSDNVYHSILEDSSPEQLRVLNDIKTLLATLQGKSEDIAQVYRNLAIDLNVLMDTISQEGNTPEDNIFKQDKNFLQEQAISLLASLKMDNMPINTNNAVKRANKLVHNTTQQPSSTNTHTFSDLLARPFLKFPAIKELPEETSDNVLRPFVANPIPFKSASLINMKLPPLPSTVPQGVPLVDLLQHLRNNNNNNVNTIIVTPRVTSESEQYVFTPFTPLVVKEEKLQTPQFDTVWNEAHNLDLSHLSPDEFQNVSEVNLSQAQERQFDEMYQEAVMINSQSKILKSFSKEIPKVNINYEKVIENFLNKAKQNNVTEDAVTQWLVETLSDLDSFKDFIKQNIPNMDENSINGLFKVMCEKYGITLDNLNPSAQESSAEGIPVGLAAQYNSVLIKDVQLPGSQSTVAKIEDTDGLLQTTAVLAEHRRQVQSANARRNPVIQDDSCTPRARL